MADLYSFFITTKNNEIIPVFKSGRTMESKYNATNDALRLVQATPPGNFYIVLGIGSGIFILKLLEKNPDAFILAFERSETDLQFLKSIENVKEISEKNNVILSDINKINQLLPEYYIPAFYGKLQIVEQRGWINENQDIYSRLISSIQKNIQFISNDFSVQAHFGKIWQKNIISNLKSYDEYVDKNFFDSNLNSKINTTKTAAVIAAGPSFDRTISYIKNEPEKFQIIATDTTYSTLIENNIIPDFVLSIDGQNISHVHFCHKNSLFSKTTFIFDLCADNSTVNHVLKNHGNIIFSSSGHPLSQYISDLGQNSFIHLYSGSGTVTIAALDFAINCGYKNIQIFGADFSYRNGKSYTKGTYLDKLYNQYSNKIMNYETTFDKLLFRTDLIKENENIFTTNVLSSYKNSFLKYLETKNISYSYQDEIYYLQSNFAVTGFSLENNKNLYKKFLDSIKSLQVTEKNSIFELNKLEIALLPLISALRFYDNKNTDFNYFLKSAYSYLPRN